MAVAHLVDGVSSQSDVPALLQTMVDGVLQLDLADIAVAFAEVDADDVIVWAGATDTAVEQRSASLGRRSRERSADAAFEFTVDAADLMDVVSPPGPGASMSVALGSSSEPIGGLSISRHSNAGWSHAEEDAIRVVAQVAGAMVLQKLPTLRAEITVAQLQRALDERVAVEQAKGYLAARARVAPDVAFDEMRREARRTSTKMNDLAKRVVAGDPIAEYLERRLSRAAPHLARPGANSGR